MATESPEGPDLKYDVGQFALTDEEEQALARFRLGIYTRPGGCRRFSKDKQQRAKQKYCSLRHDESVTGHHLSICPYGGWTISRHNRTARLLQRLILEIPGAEVRWTPRPGHWQRTSEPAEPDLRVDVPGWARLYIDVAIVTPRAGRAAGGAAADEEREKKLLYPVWAVDARIVDCDFHPFVMETYGRFGEEARLLVCKLAARAAQDRQVNAAVEISRWQQLLSLRLMKDQADLLING